MCKYKTNKLSCQFCRFWYLSKIVFVMNAKILSGHRIMIYNLKYNTYMIGDHSVSYLNQRKHRIQTQHKDKIFEEQ